MEIIQGWEDRELGNIWLQTNKRARRLTFHLRADGVHVTLPPGIPLAEVRRAVEQLRPRLREVKERRHFPRIDLNYRIDKPLFKFRLAESAGRRFSCREVEGGMELLCPPATDFSDEQVQEFLRKVLLEAARSAAKRYLPLRLQQLSRQHGLPFRSVKVNSSTGRWGSCSARQDINLSCRLMLLPPHLVDYVLLHELAHTREMNHSERFWALLDSLTEGKAKELRKELRGWE